MRESELIRLYPRLYHMAQEGSWESIQRHGLLCTEALLDRFEVADPLRSQLLTRRRPELVTLTHPVHGTAVIRDQKPLSEVKLAACLTDMTVSEWLGLLNRRVFFWVREQRLTRLLNARAYRDAAHTILVLDTARLLAAHRHDVTLSRLNSGSTVFKAQPRGSDTFSSVSAYPHPARDIAELAVTGGIREIDSVVVRVEHRCGDRILDVEDRC